MSETNSRRERGADSPDVAPLFRPPLRSGTFSHKGEGTKHFRHCERREAIQGRKARLDCFVAALLAMTTRRIQNPLDTFLMICPSG